uniref:Beta-1,4-galactosyltransferase n=1 Tax=Ciona savignyi TaxID=51511 RepID=H2Y6B3_CIOSA
MYRLRTVLNVHRRTYGILPAVCLRATHVVSRPRYQAAVLSVFLIVMLLWVVFAIDSMVLRSILLFTHHNSPAVCKEANLIREQFQERQNRINKEIEMQDQILSSQDYLTNEVRNKLHPITTLILEAGSRICPYHSNTLVGLLQVNEDESTIDADLANLESKFKNRVSVYNRESRYKRNSKNTDLENDDNQDSQLENQSTTHYGNFTQMQFSVSTVAPPIGVISPSNCHPHRRTAIVIPYRNRLQHLKVFLRHLHPFLQRQEIEYGIYVINLAGNGMFNRAKLLNIGFTEALRHYGKYDCIIFHDVDLFPEDDRNIYTCSSQPKHMSVAINLYDYILPYEEIFGGVTALTPDQFKLVNGYPNAYWGWGGEDDDMSKRIKSKCMSIFRISTEKARYVMVNHQHGNEKGNEIQVERFNLLKGSMNRQPYDGLSSLNYTVHHRLFGVLYNNITVTIGQHTMKSLTTTEKVLNLLIVLLCVFLIYLLFFK